jgi:hypothetical protein
MKVRHKWRKNRVEKFGGLILRKPAVVILHPEHNLSK